MPSAEAVLDRVDNAAVDNAARGVALLAMGRSGDALRTLRAVVAIGDATPVTRLNLALAEGIAGDRERARRQMQGIADEMPDWDEPQLRLAESLRADGRMDAAALAYEAVLVINPRREEALVSLGVLRLGAGDTAAATKVLLRCCAIAPDNAEAWDALGLAALQSGDAAAAIDAFAEAWRLVPRWLDPALHLVEAACIAGTAEAELARLEAAGLADPLDPVGATARGVLLERLGRREEAIDALEVAVALAPDAPRPTALLAGMLARTTRVDEAEKWLRRASELDPTEPRLRNDHAAVLMRKHRHAEARAELTELIATHGEQVGVLCNLATATVCCGLQDEAVALIERAITLAPDALLPRRALANALPYRDTVTGVELLAALIDCSDRAPRGAGSGAAGSDADGVAPGVGSKSALREVCSESAPEENCSDSAPRGMRSDSVSRGVPAIFANRPDPARRLRIGLLSGSLRTHPVGWLTIAGFESLDPQAFEIVVLTQHASRDAIARRFRAIAGEWHDIDTIPDAEVAALGRSLGIDVLIDLGGWGDQGTLAACALRPAPVQVKWVGMQNHSTGLAEMDFFISDRWETPDGTDRLYSERLLRLPDGYVCYSAPPDAPEVAPLPAEASGAVTFGCFNNLAKITPRTIATWARVLQRVPGARLLLKTHQFSDRITADRVRAAFAAHNVDPARITTRGSSSHRTQLAQHAEIDIVLDPFPYSGGLTTCEALWMGVPVVTMPGESFASRHSASHLSNAGLAEWVAPDVDAYVETAVARAADLPGLRRLRAELRPRLKASPLCNAPRFAANLGAALRQAWRARPTP